MQPKLTTAALAAIFMPAIHAADEVILSEVVVTASEEQQEQQINAIQINKKHIKTKTAITNDTAQLLQNVPGVNLYNAGGVSSLPSIHGLADDRVRSTVNGMSLTSACPNHMNAPLSYIDSTRVDSIQVHAGVTPVSIGGDSIGGSIAVQSAQPKFAESDTELLTSGELGAFYRSNGNGKGTNAKASVASDKYSITYTGSVAESDNYTAGGDFKTTTATGREGHTLSLDEVGSSAYKTINHALDIGMRSDNHLLNLQLGQQHIPYEGFLNQRMDLTDNKSSHVNLNYNGAFQWGEITARAYHEKTQHEMDFGDDRRYWYGSASGGPTVPNGTQCSPISATCAAGMPMQTEGKTNGLAVNAEIFHNERDAFRLGAEYVSFNLDDWWPPSGAGMWPGTFWNINDGERNRYALFSEWEAGFAPQWTSIVGLRYELVKMDTGNVQGYDPTSDGMGMMVTNQRTDANNFNAQKHRKTDHNWDISAIIRYYASANLDFELGLARKTRSPNLYERYTWSSWSMAAMMNNFAGDGNGYVGDINLESEVAHTVSFTTAWHDVNKDNWNFVVKPYYTDVTDYIDAKCNGTCAPNKFNVLKYVNQDARIYGVDVSGQTLLTSIPTYGTLSLNGLINYTKGKNRSTDDSLYNIMPFNVKIGLTHKLGGFSNTLEAQYVADKDDTSNVRNEIHTSNYNLFHLRSSYEWKQVRLDFGIENIFDKNYSLPLGGAYVGQGTTMSANAIPWGVAVPGPGRSVYAGVNFSF